MSDEDIGDICEEKCVFRKPLPCDVEFLKTFSIIMCENNISFPVISNEALDVYIVLRQVCRDVVI